MHKGKIHMSGKSMCPCCGNTFSKANGSGVEVCPGCEKKYGLAKYG